MASAEKVSIGFSGGQVVEVKIEADKLSDLRKQLDGDGGWFDLETDEGNVSLDLRQVVFLRSAAAPHGIGFGG
jgi:hypothetical protein